MKILISFFASCFLFVSALSAQVVEGDTLKEPYQQYQERPYPAANIPVSPEVAGFIAQFEDSEVGNLKAFAIPEAEIPYGYYFTGTEIGEAHKELFTDEYRDLVENGAIYATYSIKGQEKEHYIIRMPTDKGPNTLVLFETNGEVVEPVQLLAYAFCENGFCYQQDSWVTDLDGDADLDILTKYRRILPASGEVVDKVDYIYLQAESGDFMIIESDKIRVDPDKYNMEELEF